MKNCFTATLLFFLIQGLSGQNQTPLVSNLILQTDVPNGSATLQFDLSDAENDPLEISVQFSSDGGKTYSSLSGANISGDAGFPVQTGSRSVICSGLNFSNPGKYVFRVIADDKQVFDIQSLVNEVDSNRLREDLKFIQGIRHRTAGLAHLNETRDSIRSLFENAGLYFEKQTFIYTNTSGQNLLGSLPGTASAEQVFIVDAHYDTVNIAPGADDNGSGTVGMMEMARLLSRYPSKKTQRYIGFDLEESGLRGSIDYATNGILPSETVQGVFNFEMIGYWSNQPNSQTLPVGFNFLFPLQAQAVADNQYRGDFISNIANPASQSLGNLFSGAAQQYVPDLKVISLVVPSAVPADFQRSDHYPFWQSNRPALLLTDGAEFRNPCYHKACDTLMNRLNFTFMSNVVKTTLAAMAQAVEIQHADWASASFELATGTAQPAPCGFKLLENALVLQADDCISEEISIELFDLKGARVSKRSVILANGGNIPLSTQNLPAGVYALKVSYGKGVFSQKVMIR